MLQASLEIANSLLKSNEVIKLNQADHALLINLLHNPQPANDEMKSLMRLLNENFKKYKKP